MFIGDLTTRNDFVKELFSIYLKPIHPGFAGSLVVAGETAIALNRCRPEGDLRSIYVCNSSSQRGKLSSKNPRMAWRRLRLGNEPAY
jgi:hypothetical protein